MTENHPKTMMTQISYPLYELCEAEAARRRKMYGGTLRPQWRNILEELVDRYLPDLIALYPDNG